MFILPNKPKPKIFRFFSFLEFMNGLDTDKVHSFIEDCIAKQEPLIKVNTTWSSCTAVT